MASEATKRPSGIVSVLGGVVLVAAIAAGTYFLRYWTRSDVRCTSTPMKIECRASITTLHRQAVSVCWRTSVGCKNGEQIEMNNCVTLGTRKKTSTQVTSLEQLRTLERMRRTLSARDCDAVVSATAESAYHTLTSVR